MRQSSVPRGLQGLHDVPMQWDAIHCPEARSMLGHDRAVSNAGFRAPCLQMHQGSRCRDMHFAVRNMQRLCRGSMAKSSARGMADWLEGFLQEGVQSHTCQAMGGLSLLDSTSSTSGSRSSGCRSAEVEEICQGLEAADAAPGALLIGKSGIMPPPPAARQPSDTYAPITHCARQ